ncbi:hypothetical protein Tco_1000149 [Tanacetum coccineum]
MMSFLTAVVTSRYPTTNNQLRNSSNPRQQATINNGRVTLQPIQGRQTSLAAGTSRTYTPGASGSNTGKQRTVIFFYDHTTKQALGFQNPFYLKKAQQLEPKLYVGDIIEKTNVIVIPDSEETLMLAEESRCGTTSFRVKKTFEVKMNQVLNENERFLEQVINKDIVNVIMNSSADIASVNVHECEKCLKLETELQTDFIEKEIYDKLFKSFSNSWKYIASL